MTTVPQPADPTTSFTATYDAWNRLVKLTDGANTVQENEYDARRFRTVRKDYTAGALSETRRFYYTEGWQSIEERLGTSTAPEVQHVWGLRYIDDIALRDRDATADGTLDERLYAQQDANWNVVSITDQNGDVQERYVYSAYGVLEFLSALFIPRTTSSYAWTTLYAGYRMDATSHLMCIRHRYYSGAIGVWSLQDPLSYTDSLNLYAYVSSRPLDATDPSGLEMPSRRKILLSQTPEGRELLQQETQQLQEWHQILRVWKEECGEHYRANQVVVARVLLAYAGI